MNSGGKGASMGITGSVVCKADPRSKHGDRRQLLVLACAFKAWELGFRVRLQYQNENGDANGGGRDSSESVFCSIRSES